MELKAFGELVELDERLVSENKNEVRRQVQEYLDGDRKQFDLGITYPETFTGLVIQEMQQIPYGETRSYGEIADRIDSSPVAVGQACGRNPLPLVVPCHRVTSRNGLGGYAFGADLKKQLLQLEESSSSNRPSV